MQIFGILNITPDSFSDTAPENPSLAAQKMLQDGAYAIDVGAESTRPNATPLTHAQEWKRLEPFLEKVNQESGIRNISIDTYHPETAEKALKYPHVEYINDVSGLKNDEMARIISENQAKIIIMHSLTVPANKEIVIQGDPVEEILSWLGEISQRLKNFQISTENVIIDIGLGFGKTAEQSIELLKNIGKITKKTHEIGAKILVGHSRKSFLTKFTDKPAKDRDFETAIITNYLATQNIDYIRVHNVEINKTAINIRKAIANPSTINHHLSTNKGEELF